MSAETIQWLNTMTLIGFTEKRGKAWHYRASDQDVEPNHYPLAVPTQDVHRRLFNWQPVSRRVAVEVPTSREAMTHRDSQGRPARWEVQQDRQAITRDDTHATLGLFKSGYRIHPYAEWLVTNVEALLDGGLEVGSAGLLRGGAQAWVQVEMPETIEGPGGVAHRPFITAATSLDGSLATTYLTGSTLVVCDNTLSAALGSAAEKIKIRHSVKSLGRITKVRDALGLAYTVADDFNAQLQAMLDTEVSDRQWKAFLDVEASMSDDTGKPKVGRARTIAWNKREALQRLWAHDERVSPWAGTLFGVVQAVNTYEHHVMTTKGDDGRVARNMARMVTGEWDKVDQRTATQALKVLARV